MLVQSACAVCVGRRDLGLLADEHVAGCDLDDRLCAGGPIHPRAALAVRQQGAEVGLWWRARERDDQIMVRDVVHRVVACYDEHDVSSLPLNVRTCVSMMGG